ncbi:WxL protein peptidoglycan domain-containing protein [Cellulomonas sp. ICMP 17802]|uniref:WxL protein peptidoglycan domain-containing protein n=1 Tax=Cellulomonas sp. ICMP 17802 TaxID=3239199 RepID=UPI00351AE8CE
MHTSLFGRRSLLRAVLVTVLAAGGAGLAGSQAVAADDVATAWSVSPAGADGLPDGSTRFELTMDPGATGAVKVVVSNASTVERTFDVYGADALNTSAGGYDLEAHATAPTDVGAWVTASTPTVTVPALSDAVVDLALAVPAAATPGDHPGGVVVSLASPTANADGVVLDTRVAVRLNVRVSGDVTPRLEVRDVGATWAGSWVPFGFAPATVSYAVANTGNVKIVGKPRLRITGPFGVHLVTTRPGATQEVLPGQSFTVRSVLPAVLPLGLLTAVVDVEMEAAPGPQTDIPLVSSTSRTAVVAVPWTGLALVLLVALGVWTVLRARRRRRREQEDAFRRLEEEPATTPTLYTVVPVLLALLVLGAPTTVHADPDQQITLSVPAAPARSHHASGGSSVVPSSAPAAPDAGPSASAPAPSAAPVTAAAPDLVWADRARRAPASLWVLLGLGLLALAGAVGRHLMVRGSLP